MDNSIDFDDLDNNSEFAGHILLGNMLICQVKQLACKMKFRFYS